MAEIGSLQYLNYLFTFVASSALGICWLRGDKTIGSLTPLAIYVFYLSIYHYIYIIYIYIYLPVHLQSGRDWCLPCKVNISLMLNKPGGS